MEKAWATVAVMAVAVAVAMVGVSGQDSTSCVNSLVPCANYLNGTAKPPKSCCDPLLEVVKTQKACLCGLLKNKQIIQSFHVNLTEALAVPSRCGMNVSTDACANANSSTGTPSSGTTTTSPSSTSSSTSSGSTPKSTSPSAAAAAGAPISALLVGFMIILAISFHAAGDFNLLGL